MYLVGAFWNDTCMSVQHNRKTGVGRGGREETRARYEPPHRTSWANSTVGGQTALVVGGRGQVQASVILFEYDVHSSRKLSAGETVNTFSARGCSQANRSSRNHSRPSDFFFFFVMTVRFHLPLQKKKKNGLKLV